MLVIVTKSRNSVENRMFIFNFVYESYILTLGLYYYSIQKLNANNFVTGMVLGSYFWGCLADTKGRKIVLVSTLLMDGFVGIISSFVQILPIFMACRFINGFS